MATILVVSVLLMLMWSFRGFILKTLGLCLLLLTLFPQPITPQRDSGCLRSPRGLDEVMRDFLVGLWGGPGKRHPHPHEDPPAKPVTPSRGATREEKDLQEILRITEFLRDHPRWRAKIDEPVKCSRSLP